MNLRCNWLVVAGMLLGSVCATGALAQGTFEGMVSYKMTMQDGKTAIMRYYQLGSRIRQEYDAQGQSAASITDGTTGDQITIIPQQKKYMVINLKQAAGVLAPMAQALGGGQRHERDFSKLKVTATGRRETIAGISCEHYLFENTERQQREGQMDICGATGMGFVGSPYQTGSVMPSTAAMLKANNPELARLLRQGFFPLKMTMTDEGKQAVIEVTQVDRHRPDASLFAPPPGYTKIEIPGMPHRP